ncbi:MAG: hypothetical protein GC138_05365 [Gammaproteobacteria bacterium]|nr:hypothetical protein [Gammaproteobacteria bacterium]
MLTETGRVTGIDDGYAWVEVERQTACGSCSANKSCGSGILSKVFSTRPLRLKLENRLSVSVGDQVLVAIEDGLLIRSSMIVYAVPLAFMIIGAMIGESLQTSLSTADGEGFSILGGIAGLVLAILGLKRYSVRMAGDPRYQARMVELIRAAGSPAFSQWTIQKE